MKTSEGAGPSRTVSQPASIKPEYLESLIIENISPLIDEGLSAAKGVVGESVEVLADIFKEGHDILGAALRTRHASESAWSDVPMERTQNDRWRAVFVPQKVGPYEYTFEAWTDRIATWLDYCTRKCLAEDKIASDLSEGLTLLKEAAASGTKKDADLIGRFIDKLKTTKGMSSEILKVLQDEAFISLTRRMILKGNPTLHKRAYRLEVDRKRAQFGSWYEFFPRSQGKDPQKSATFKECVQRLPDIKKMGFNVLYLPPIHPIGKTNRKGPNNALVGDKNAPGSPWAIGSEAGGHKAVHPDLGTLKDFENFVAAASDYGIEIALDFAAQCSPDHPYVKSHPEWFYRLPDGTIRFAENPPKKYQDIYPIDFYCKDREALWQELKSIFFFWIQRGVKIFRVDNPHTKPLRFWQWVIGEIKKEHPDVLFLAEAFTRPSVMKLLAKVGFSQSYTYFTWRNTKFELRQYLEELTQTDMRYYFRPNFFVNTPDILTEILQHGGRPAFKQRLVLAATLASTYGIYSGYELCENTPVRPGSEEYLDSEKYQIRVRDWNKPGNIIDFITRLNRIRVEQPALQQTWNLEFFDTDTDSILAYAKWNEDRSNVIIVVVNLDPYHLHEDVVHMPIARFGIQDWQTFQVKDLVSGEKYYWKGRDHFVRLDPQEPAHIFQLNL